MNFEILRLCEKDAAAAAEIATVRMMTRVPGETDESTGRYANAQLAAIAMTISARITRFSLAGGTMIARNMPYRPTLSALTMFAGSTLPITTPKYVPSDQPGSAIAITP